MKAWIFQGNPKEFDINGYLTNYKRVVWTVRQSHCEHQIEIGDRVFFWRSKGGQKGPYGVVAVGNIASKPLVMSDHPDSLPYWIVKPEAGIALRCWVDVDHCAVSSGKLLPVEDIARDELLGNLRILKFRQNTNYLITEEESDRLFKLYTNVIQEKKLLSSFSWAIDGSNHAVKMLDKSAFLHNGSGIPKGIRWFFLKRELGPGERVDIALSVDGSTYPAHIAMESQGTARTRLFWDSDFTSLLHNSFPYHLQQYQQNREPNGQIIMRLERIDGFGAYSVSFGAEVPETDISQDIEAESIEEVGPRMEGRVKEFYGRRYERDPVNRKKAIEYHGLTCKACGFNFEKVYGERGAGYIEVHHVKPIYTFNQMQKVDPKADLVTLCSNCHRMVHRRADSILTLQELQSMFRS